MTNAQARRFLLHRHGLIGCERFSGKPGVLEFIRSVGSVQFDPVDVCGRNAEIVLHARVQGFERSMLDELLYKDRLLVDFFDKNLCIFPIEDWPCLAPEPGPGTYAAAYDSRGGDAVARMKPLIRRLIQQRGSVSAREIEHDERIVWDWGTATSLSRVALESMYFRGELVIHHRKGSVKSYAFAEDHIPSQLRDVPTPFGSREERVRWLVKRRIGAVGMLWNRASDAWLGVKLSAAERNAAFAALLDAGDIFEIHVEGIREPLYIRETERPILELVLSGGAFDGRAEFIAPLDSLLWDRRLIEEIFGFRYKWEIYTPAEKRKYGPYTLPFLWGEGFAGRVDMERQAETLIVKRFWPEQGVKLTGQLRKDFKACAKRFAAFNGCTCVEYRM